MKNKTYDILKWVAMIFLPALSALWLGLANLWGFPYGDEIAGTIALVDTFLGAVLMVSTYQYNKRVG